MLLLFYFIFIPFLSFPFPRADAARDEVEWGPRDERRHPSNEHRFNPFEAIQDGQLRNDHLLILGHHPPLPQSSLSTCMRPTQPQSHGISPHGKYMWAKHTPHFPKAGLNSWRIQTRNNKQIHECTGTFILITRSKTPCGRRLWPRSCAAG